MHKLQRNMNGAFEGFSFIIYFSPNFQLLMEASRLVLILMIITEPCLYMVRIACTITPTRALITSYSLNTISCLVDAVA